MVILWVWSLCCAAVGFDMTKFDNLERLRLAASYGTD